MKIKRIIATALSIILIMGSGIMQTSAIVTPRVSIAPRASITPRVTPRVTIPKSGTVKPSTPKTAPKTTPKTTAPRTSSNNRISLNPFSRYFFLWFWLFGNNDENEKDVAKGGQ